MKKKINNGIFYVVISLVAVFAVVSIGFAYNGFGTPKNVIEGDYIEAQSLPSEENLGSAAGNDFQQRVNFYENFVRGGDIFNASTTLTIARTITAGEICNNKTITVNSAAVASTYSAASLDLTLAATSTLFAECLKNEGDEYEFDLVNQSPTAATTTEIVAGTGCQIVYGVADGDATIPGQKGATITLKRIKDWLANGGTKDCIVKVYEWN